MNPSIRYPVRKPFPTKAITHNGVFHADDVFAYAFLEMVNSEISLMRVMEITDEMRSHDDWVIFDIGGGEFDHHTENKYRNDKEGNMDLTSPYAAFGLVVEAYWPYLLNSPYVYRTFDRDLVRLIDKQDAAGELAPGVPSTLSKAIFAFNPNWNEDQGEEDFMESFRFAAKFAKVIIGNEIAKIEAKAEADRLVKKACTRTFDYKYYTVFLDRYLPFGTPYLAIKGVRWVCYPSMRGGYQIYTINRGGVNVQTLDPEMIEALKQNENCIFVHPLGFTASFKTLESAKEYLLYLADKYEGTVKKDITEKP